MQNAREARVFSRSPALSGLLVAIMLALTSLPSVADPSPGHLPVPLASDPDAVSALLLYDVPCGDCPALLNRLQQALAEAGVENAQVAVLPAVFDDVSMLRARTALVADHCDLPDAALSAALNEAGEQTANARAERLFDFVEPEAGYRCQSLRAVESVFTHPDVQQKLQRSLAATRVAQPRRLPTLVLGGLRIDAVDRWPDEVLRRQLAAELEALSPPDSPQTIFRGPDTPRPH